MSNLVRIWAAFGFALFGVTWKLWTPQTLFPQIPFFEAMVDAPAWIDWIALAFVAASLLACLMVGSSDAEISTDLKTGSSRSGKFARIAPLVFASGLGVLILLDQNRLQPWAWQFLIFGLIIGLSNPRQVIPLLRWIVVSIYLYSAISKLDYQFVHTTGSEMLSMLAGLLGIEATQWSTQLKSAMVLLFPIGELLVAIGLAIPKTRRLACFAAVAMHVTLLVLLGPFGMKHQPGVLIWNLFFIAQAFLLFWFPTEARDNSRLLTNPIATLIAVLAIGFPATQWIGISDHWPAWQVYSPSSSRANVLGELEDVPSSIELLSVPNYPQARVQLANAMAIIEKHYQDDFVAVEVCDQSNRFTGQRVKKVLSKKDQFKMQAERYWLNTNPRYIWFEE